MRLQKVNVGLVTLLISLISGCAAAPMTELGNIQREYEYSAKYVIIVPGNNVSLSQIERRLGMNIERIDAIYEKVFHLLKLWLKDKEADLTKPRQKVMIYVFGTRAEMQSEYKKTTGKHPGLKTQGFYSADVGCITASLWDMNEFFVAHELAHHILRKEIKNNLSFEGREAMALRVENFF